MSFNDNDPQTDKPIGETQDTEQLPLIDDADTIEDADSGGLAGAVKQHRKAIALAAGIVLVAGLGIGGFALANTGSGTPEVQPKTTVAASKAIKDKADKLDPAEITNMCTDLTLDSADLGVASDQVKVTCGNGRVMVEQTDTDTEPAKLVDATARRSAALARSLRGEKVAGGEVSDVTWAAVDADGNVRVAVSNDPDKAPTGGSTADVVNGSGGHVIADDIWAADGVHDQGFDQNAGEVVKPSGEKVEAGAAAKDDKAEESSDGTDKKDGGKDDPKSDSKSDSGSKSDSSKPASGGSGSTGSAAGTSKPTSSGNSGSSSSAPSKPAQKKWVVDTPAWDEPVYSQVWVSNMVYTRHPRYWVSSGGTMVGPFDSVDAASSWVHNDIKNGGIGGSVIDDSYTTQEDQGHYEQQQTGTVHHDEVGHWE